MKINERISAFSALGAMLRSYIDKSSADHESWNLRMDEACQQSTLHNPWFTAEHLRLAIASWGDALKQQALEDWINPYASKLKHLDSKRIGIVMAGNIPVVGFHDLLSVLICGHTAIVKCSGQDRFLIPLFVDFLKEQHKDFSNTVEFTEDRISRYDAVIATGGNNSSRYFESYFSTVPHIIRKNRNSVAILNGDESQDSLDLLCNDLLQYFGLGCRNVARLFVPEGYSFDGLLRAAEKFRALADHHKYASNYVYYKTIFMMNSDLFWENGVMILKQADAWSSPVSVVYYSEYSDISKVQAMIQDDRVQLQCVVTDIPGFDGSQTFGTTQQPALNDYADGIDTIAFLSKLSHK